MTLKLKKKHLKGNFYHPDNKRVIDLGTANQSVLQEIYDLGGTSGLFEGKEAKNNTSEPTKAEIIADILEMEGNELLEKDLKKLKNADLLNILNK